MIIPAVIRRKYDELSLEMDFLENSVRTAIFKYCNSKGFAYLDRRKDVGSLAEKIETGRFKSWSELDDLFACTIVIPLLADEPAVLDFLHSAFSVVSIKRRGSTQKSPEVFRFDATRFIGRLTTYPSKSGNAQTCSTSFEVQIRTAFEHAWSATTHALSYKVGEVNWKTKRLSAQLKEAVEQLDALVNAFEQSREPLVEHSWPEVEAKKKIVAGFQSMVHDGKLPTELAPKDWSRFADNLYSLLCSGDRKKGGRAGDNIDSAMSVIIKRISTQEPRMVPHSISLLQYSFALVITEGVISLPLHNFCPLVTDELNTIYPTLGEFPTRFRFE